MDTSKVLFVGIGSERVAWYRCALPAMFMGADWIGMHGVPPKIWMATGYVKGATALPDFDAYDVIVIQQPSSPEWFRWIKGMRAKGKKIVYEIDDYIHTIRNMEDHDYRFQFGKKRLQQYELCMRGCDAMICSTEYIARRYQKYNKHVYVCENGLDTGRYKITRPPRGDLNGKPAVMIGWAGATGHSRAAGPWLKAVSEIMSEHENTCFVSIGQPWAEEFNSAYPNRAIAIPFTLIEQYPAAMAMFDISLAPVGASNFHKGKSQLRFYESAALGLPVIGDPSLYSEIEDGVTGLHAETTEEVLDQLRRLIAEPDLRRELGTNALRYVYEKHDMRVAVKSWVDALTEIAA